MLLRLLLSLLAPQDPAAAILGRWEGTSTCVQAEWNRGCLDAVARYDFARHPALADVVLVRGYRQQADGWQFMGEIALIYDATAERWAGQWTNGEVHNELSYELRGTDLVGKLIDIPGRRKARDIVVHRVPLPGDRSGPSDPQAAAASTPRPRKTRRGGPGLPQAGVDRTPGIPVARILPDASRGSLRPVPPHA